MVWGDDDDDNVTLNKHVIMGHIETYDSANTLDDTILNPYCYVAHNGQMLGLSLNNLWEFFKNGKVAFILSKNNWYVPSVYFTLLTICIFCTSEILLLLTLPTSEIVLLLTLPTSETVLLLTLPTSETVLLLTLSTSERLIGDSDIL